MVKIIFLTFLLITFASCGLERWWGEPAAPVPIIDLSATSAAKGAPPITDIWEGSEERSKQAFEHYKKTINELWSKVEGDKKGVFTERELRALINERVIKLSNDAADDIQKVMAVKSLLGIKGALKKERLDEIFNWIDSSRNDLRRAYQKFKNDSANVLFGDIKHAINVGVGLLNLLNWKKSNSLFLQEINILLGAENSERDEKVMHFAEEVMGLVCPRYPMGKIDLPKLSACLTSAVSEFGVGEAWFNYQLKMSDNNHDGVAITESLVALKSVAQKWFKNPQLRPITTDSIIEFLEIMELDPPDNLKSAFAIVEELNGRSSRKIFFPEIVLDILEVFFKEHREIFKVIPIFQEAFKNGKCEVTERFPSAVPPIKSWADCALSLDEIKKLYIKSTQQTANPQNVLHAFGTVKSTVSPSYARSVRPITPNFIANLLMLKSISAHIIFIFDNDRDGSIRSASEHEKNEVLEVIQQCVVSVDTLTTYIDRLKRGIKPKQSLVAEAAPPPLDGLNLEGISQVAVLAGSDILVIRDKEERMIFEKIFSNFTNLFPRGAVNLDLAGVTAVMSLIDSFGDYRQKLLDSPEFTLKTWKQPVTEEIFIDRESLLKNIPAILEKFFPDTYRNCLSVGMKKSCVPSFDGVLPDSGPEKEGYVEASSFDLIVLVASAIEGIRNSCDFNNSGDLSWALFDGRDELDCAFTRISHASKRLIDSKVIEGAGTETTKAILSLFDSTFVTRTVGKAALVTGSLKRPLRGTWNFITHKEATIGTMYLLMNELVSSE